MNKALKIFLYLLIILILIVAIFYGKNLLKNGKASNNNISQNSNISQNNNTNLSEKEKIEIKSLKRGECLMFAGEEHILTKIDVAEFEKNIIG